MFVKRSHHAHLLLLICLWLTPQACASDDPADPPVDHDGATGHAADAKVSPDPDASADATGGTSDDDAGEGRRLASGECADADERGFFTDCPGCPTGDCLGLSQQGTRFEACGCSSDNDCPCGFSCGCIELAPSVPLCRLCLR